MSLTIINFCLIPYVYLTHDIIDAWRCNMRLEVPTLAQW